MIKSILFMPKFEKNNRMSNQMIGRMNSAPSTIIIFSTIMIQAFMFLMLTTIESYIAIGPP